MMEYTEEYSADEWNSINDEFKRVKDNIYLDHAGATLYSERQLRDTFEVLSKDLYCNPHTGKATEDLIDQVRYRILKQFHTTSNDYSVVFTAGATAALKLIAETFEFNGGSFGYLQDNHTSVLGMRELVQTTSIKCVKKTELMSRAGIKSKENPNSTSNSLFVYAAQCNFSGFKYSLELINNIQDNGFNTDTEDSNCFVCLDAASFVSTNPIDLSKYRPDFMCISFYKIFGYPTGLGALIVSKRGEEVLRKRYYGGGTVKIAMTERNWHRKRDNFQDRFEDGTLSFLSIISLLVGYDTLERLVMSRDDVETMERISIHTFNLAKHLYLNLKRLTYVNGQPVIKFYHDTEFKNRTDQGGIVNFNVFNPDGSIVGFAEMAAMASIYNIYLRTGCFCNPGACQRHLELTNEDLKAHYSAGHVCGDLMDLVDGIPTGSVRISIGYMTQKSDVNALLRMITETYLTKSNKLQLNPQKSIVELNGHGFVKSEIKLKEICVFPVKSCGAFKVRTKWSITRRGLKFDRQWMIVTSNGVCMTQKTNTRLCLIKPIIDVKKGILTLQFPYVQPVKVPLNTDELNRNSLASLCQSKVCNDRIQGIDCGDTVAEWLSDVLCMQDLRLIRQSSSDTRTFLNKTKTDSIAQSISLANQAQFLLINTASVEWLVQKVDDWVELAKSTEDRLSGAVDRFRGNLIIESARPLEELKWSRIQIGQVQLKTDGPCTRCQMICIDQATGDKTTEPLRTISREFQGKVKFGIYMGQVHDGEGDNSSDDDRELYIKCNDSLIAEY